MTNEDIRIYAQNRELSWLKFNKRVLHEALDDSNPLYEKMKFVSIFSSNLKEFFMVRVGSLDDLRILNDERVDNKTGMNAKEQLDKIYEVTRELYKEKDQIYFNVSNQFKEYGIEHLTNNFNAAELRQLETIFRTRIFPILSPMVISKSHPFPFLDNNSQYLISELKKGGNKFYGILWVPKQVPKFYKFKDKNLKIILTEKILEYFVDEIYQNYEVGQSVIVSATRNADILMDNSLYDEDDDYKDLMKKLLKKRKRLQCVRLETNKEMSKDMEDFMIKNLTISKEQVFISKSPIDMSYVFELKEYFERNTNHYFQYDKYTPQINGFNMNESIIKQIEDENKLLIYPFDSISPFIKLLEEAADREDVNSIKITIYRLAKNSKIVQALTRAAENGKQVVVLMELRARFDEQNNIDYSDVLYNSGCTVIYGYDDYKVHSKICLITYNDNGKFKYITQIGTGNYNESTSKQYTDISYITADKIVGEDATSFFNNMALGNVNGRYQKILQSPSSFKQTIMKLIDDEIKKGLEGKIFFKFNSFTDKDLIKKLSEASRAGVQIKMNIRGICCMLPGIEGYTDNVEIRSIVGRYLEHARIYKFGDNGPIYISSADLMTRNTERRVEVAVLIEDQKSIVRINDYIESIWNDNIKARMINSKGDMIKLTGEKKFNSQEYNMKYSIEKNEASQKEETIFDKIIKIFKKK